MTVRTVNPIDQHVGKRVKMRRLLLDITQEKLAAGLGITFQQVQKYEKGVNRMGASRLQRVAEILQTPVPFFFEGAPGQFKPDGSAPSPAYVSDFLATSEGLALINAFTRVKNDKLRRAIVRVVEEIVGDE